jgi:hypothetical protein
VTPVEAILVGIAALMVGAALGALAVEVPARRREDPTVAWLRALARVARERPVQLPPPGPRSISADLSQVLSILDGPARDDAVVRVARDRLDEIRRAL